MQELTQKELQEVNGGGWFGFGSGWGSFFGTRMSLLPMPGTPSVPMA
ncbi:bacteriocin [Shewanella sp. 0m-8]